MSTEPIVATGVLDGWYSDVKIVRKIVFLLCYRKKPKKYDSIKQKHYISPDLLQNNSNTKLCKSFGTFKHLNGEDDKIIFVSFFCWQMMAQMIN